MRQFAIKLPFTMRMVVAWALAAIWLMFFNSLLVFVAANVSGAVNQSDPSRRIDWLQRRYGE
jgi:hypothetical protein